MILENGRIDSKQLTFLIMGFVFGSSVILSPGRIAGPDAWFAIILGLGEGLLFILIYSTLAARFREQTFVEISEKVYGSIIGKIIALCFLVYVFHLGSLVLRNFSDFFTIVAMPETPSIAFLVVILLVCMMAVKHGIEVLARCSQVLVLLSVLTFFAIVFLVLNIFDPKNLQPILQSPLSKIIWGAHGAAAFPFGETVVFMMIISFVNRNQKIKLPIIKGVFIAGIFFVLTSIGNVGVLGTTESIYTYPSFQVTRLITIPAVDLRIEILIFVNFLTMGFVKIAVLLYATTLGISQVLGLRSYRPLVLPIGILMVFLSLIDFTSVSENIRFAQIGYSIWALPFEIGIPMVTLLIAMIRKLPRRGFKSN